MRPLSKTRLSSTLGTLFLIALGAPADAQFGQRQRVVEIETPNAGAVLTDDVTSIEVVGESRVGAAVPRLDLLLLMDASSSLADTDPDDDASASALALADSLPGWTGIRIGVVAFGRTAKVRAPLGSDRNAIAAALSSIERGETTDLARGIQAALDEFDRHPRDSTERAIVLFTDGKANEKRVLGAGADAAARRVAIHTVVLGNRSQGVRLMQALTAGTAGRSVRLEGPRFAPDALLDLETPGVETVTIEVNESPPIEAALIRGRFRADVPIELGTNDIVATVVDAGGRSHRRALQMSLRPDGCAELEIQARAHGEPALSISRRQIEIVIDASQSMWGQIDGVSKMEIAKQTLDGALAWLPNDLDLSLRAYGHRDAPSADNCQDTALLVEASRGNRDAIQRAIDGLQPRGQTPLAYALEQLADDFGDFVGERAVVLVTDGLESCGGDAAAAARQLQADGPVPVHVVGFGLGSRLDEDLSSLQAIAEASGGRFVTAASAEELERALITTVGTRFRVLDGDATITTGALGSGDILRLPAGSYTVALASRPPVEATVSLDSEFRHTLVFERRGEQTTQETERRAIRYSLCESASVVPEGESFAAARGRGTREPRAVGPPATPTGRRVQVLEVDGGSIEVWETTRAEGPEWQTLVRHRSIVEGVDTAYRGPSREAAEQTARDARSRLFLHMRWIAPAKSDP